MAIRNCDPFINPLNLPDSHTSDRLCNGFAAGASVVFKRMALLSGVAALLVVAALSDRDRAERTASIVLGSAWTLADVVSGTYGRPDESRRKAKVQRVANKPAKKSVKATTRVAQVSRGKRRNLADGYRTLCVRLCDGYYFPISAAATPAEFWRDEEACRSSCATPAKLFVYRNKDGSADTMTDLAGMHYGALKTAFQYRVSYDASCTCSPAPWTEAAAAKHRLHALNEAAAAGDLSASLARVPLASEIRATEHVARTRTGADLVVASAPQLKVISEVQRSLTRQVAERTFAARKARTVRTAAVETKRVRVVRTSTRVAVAAPRRARVVHRARPVRLSDSRTVVWVHR